MPDRTDPSQYLVDETNTNDNIYYGDTTANDDQIQAHPSGHYVESGEMTGYVDPGIRDDYLTENPGQYRTRPLNPKTRIVGNYRPFPQAGGIMTNGVGLIAGFNLHETTGTARADIVIHDGTDSSSPAMLFISLAPGESSRDWYFPGGLKFKYGIYAEIRDGSIEGVFYMMETENVQ